MLSRLHWGWSLVLLLCVSAPLDAQEQGVLPNGPDVNLVYAKCQQCHPISYVTDSAGLPDFLWLDTLSLMRQLGMQVTEEEEQKLYVYLTTYLGTNPPPETVAETASEIDGKLVYDGSCAVCHGTEGGGIPGAFPPIAGHASELATVDRSYLPLVVLYGVAGKVEIANTTYDAVMPGWSQLSDQEVAAVLNYVTAWGESNVDAYRTEEIAEARTANLSGAEVQSRRPDLP